MIGFIKKWIDATIDERLASLGAAEIITHNLRDKPVIWGDPSRLLMGTDAIVNNATLNTNSGRIEIGDGTIFGHNVSIITGTHPIDQRGLDRHSFPLEGRDIIIGKGVWVATNAVVLGPCTIGDNAVIAAGAVVIGGDIPPNTVYGGVPAKFIKTLGESDEEHRAMDAQKGS